MDIKKEETPEANTEISKVERNILDKSQERNIESDDIALERSELDNTDEDEVPLNEKSSADDISGRDLDIPGSEDDDAMEDIGEEDEENNGYSNADTE